MAAFFLIELVLVVLLFYFLWKTFGEKLFRQVTHDPELEVVKKLERVRERMAALPTPEEAETSDMPLGSVEVLRAGFQREERQLLAALERVRREKSGSWLRT